MRGEFLGNSFPMNVVIGKPYLLEQNYSHFNHIYTVTILQSYTKNIHHQYKNFFLILKTIFI